MAGSLPLPKYHSIYLVLRQQLKEGAFVDGLPGEFALMEQFDVSRVTVRKALELLEAEGLVKREPGRGTRPVAQAAAADRPHLTGLLENLVTMGLKTAVKVVEVTDIRASESVARALAVPVGTMVQKAVRVRSTKEGPVSRITTYVPQDLAAGFGRRELARKPLLLLLEESGVRVGRAHQSISACLADVHAARHLDVSVGAALLAVRRLVYDIHERPVQWLYGLYRPDRYEYQMELSRVGSIDAKVWVSKDATSLATDQRSRPSDP
jgi:GntR family transcriptional regulator